MNQKLAYRRVIVKVSGEYLSGDGVTIDPQRLLIMTKDLAAAHALGAEIGVVVGGGNIFRGRQADDKMLKQMTADYMGMLGTQINGLALRDALRAVGVSAVLEQCATLAGAEQAQEHMADGKICIFVGGTGLPFFTTDTTAVLRALQTNAEIVLKATGVDGVYSDDPNKNPHAKKYDQLTFQQALDEKLGVMDATAFTLCQQYNMPIGVFKLGPGALTAVISGATAVGTLVNK